MSVSFLQSLYFEDIFDLSSGNTSLLTTAFNSSQSTDSFLATQAHVNLVGHDLKRTPSEARYSQEQLFQDTVQRYTDIEDPILSSKIDLRRLLFSSACTYTKEESTIPDLLLHHGDDVV